MRSPATKRQEYPEFESAHPRTLAGGRFRPRRMETIMIDMLLAAFHFLLVFTLVAILAAQSALIRPGMTTDGMRLAASLDRAYGASAVLLLGIGFARVYWGAKGSLFYLSNPLFWAKIGLFATIAVLSIPPTLQLIRWTKQAVLEAEFLPPTEQVKHMQWWLRAEGVALLAIPFLAAAMARGYGL
jgi:putative membrane protein